MTTAYERLRAALESGGYHLKDGGHGRFVSQCPGHDDRNPSLSVTAIEGSVLVYCHAGCATEDVLAALELTKGDLFDNRRDTTYAYPGGRKVHRKSDKGFPQSGNKADRSLFRSDRIADASEVFVCEGEKDVLAAEAAGAVAVCPAMGAGKAHLADWNPLRGKHVTVIADNDEPGRKHAAQVVEQVTAAGAASVRVVRSAVGKDLADHIAAGKTIEELVADDPTPEGMPRLWRALDLRPATPPRWLAKGRLPLAAISLLVGDEGIGKSLLWVLIVAAVTTGKPLPAFGIPARDPGRVLLVCTEDDWTTTVRPRLEVAGADLTMVDVICTEDDGSGSPVFPRDLHLITAAEPAPALIVVDAWLDTVSVGMSVRDPQQARQALHPWKEIATATDAAVLLLTHTNRVASTNPRDRYGVTGELRKKARMTLFAQADEDGHLVVGPEKMNTAAPIAASVFAIQAVQHFPATDDHDGTVPVLSYVGESEMTAREHLAATADPERGDEGGNPAKRFLVDYLLRQGGEAHAGDVIKAGRAAGFNEQELKDARRRGKPRLDSRKASFGDGWVWAIPTGEGGTFHENDAEADQGGTKTDQGGVGGTDSDMPPVSPPSPPSPPTPPTINAPPGGVTASTPGQTERVEQALANAARKSAQAGTVHHCQVCGVRLPAYKADQIEARCCSKAACIAEVTAVTA